MIRLTYHYAIVSKFQRSNETLIHSVWSNYFYLFLLLNIFPKNTFRFECFRCFNAYRDLEIAKEKKKKKKDH